MPVQLEWLFLGNRFEEDDEGNEHPSPIYSTQALLDVNLYRLVKLTGYTERELDRDISMEFATRLLRADSAYAAAEAEQRRRDTPKDTGR